MTEKATGAGFSLALCATTRLFVPLNVLGRVAQAFDVLFYLTSAEPVGANVYVPDVPPHRFHEKVPEFVLI
jgi:hypothetical protein